MKENKSVYIHIPFCKSICSYCDFCKFFYNEKWLNDYLDALENEIHDRYLDEPIKTIYIGGGTPSALNLKYIERLFTILKCFNLERNCEFTFECNLNDITDNLLKTLVKNGVNRISIGIESFNEDNLKFLNRKATYQDAQAKISLCKKYGLNNINVDLIYALPKETIKILKKDLKLLKTLDIKHISTYSLMIEKNTMLAYKNVKPIDEETDAKMYKLICKYLKRKGFIHYEVSNFAKKGYESKHNLVYWNNEEYYGFGVGASGYTEGIRYDNTKSLTDYFQGKYILQEEILSEKEKMDYEIILGLRKTKGISIKEFYNKYHVNIQSKFEIEKLIKNKDLIYKRGNIFINPSKLYIMNEILVQLI